MRGSLYCHAALKTLPVVAATMVFLAGCRTVSVSGRSVTTPDVSYDVGPLPDGGSGWRRLNLQDNDLAYLARGSEHSLAVNSTCGGAVDAPLPVLTQHLLIGFTERKETESQLIPLDGREALRTRHTAKLDGVPIELLFVVIKKDGCVYDFTYLSPPQHFEERVADFDALVQGFHAQERR